MSCPADRMYSESHEWFLIDGDVVTIGITKHAADELTDITYIELPSVGASVDAGSAFGEVESVKATSEIFSAVAGEIVEVNQALEDQPELVNNDPFGEGWIVRIKTSNMNPIRELMDAEGYEKAIL
ncbi:MAG: glycine cleavage system protein GcvH [Planctomycetota bacterium]